MQTSHRAMGGSAAACLSSFCVSRVVPAALIMSLNWSVSEPVLDTRLRPGRVGPLEVTAGTRRGRGNRVRSAKGDMPWLVVFHHRLNRTTACVGGDFFEGGEGAHR